MADPKRVVERHLHGREEVLGFLGVFWDAFPDGRLETSGLLAEGSVVAAEGRFIGTPHRCHAHAGGRCRGHGTERRLPLDVEL